METCGDRKMTEQLKRMLVSRDTSRQLVAVNFIYDTLQKSSNRLEMHQTVLEYLIKNDICIYLGEASATLCVELLGKIISCIKSFSNVTVFYKNSYAAFTTASLIRAILLYIKEEKKENIVQNILYLLNEMFKNIEKKNCTPVLSDNSSYDTPQIFTLLNTIIDKTGVTNETVLLATKLLHTMISDKNILSKFNQKIVNDIMNTLNKYCKYLIRMLNDNSCNKNNYFSCIIGLISHIGIDALNICGVMKNYSPNNDAKRKFELVEFHNSEIRIQIRSMEDIFNCVQEILNVLILKVKDGDKSIDQTAYRLYLLFLNMLMRETMLKEMMPEFAEKLIQNDFLIFLPSLRAKSTDYEFRKLCQMNLAELIVMLSHQRFNLSKWKGGIEEFRNHIYMSSSFGADVSLVKNGKLTIEKANCKLSMIISADIKNAYTHHVKIIEWTYSSTRIPFTVQNKVLTLWLENERELPLKLLTVSAVWWSLLDVIQNNNHDIALIATEILKHCLDNVCNNDEASRVKESLWETLPNMLIFYIEENEIKNELTLACVLQLCYSYVPKDPDMDTILKTVLFLTSIIPLFVEKSDELLFNYMSEAFCLINVSLKHQNKTVLSRFIDSEIFMETVYDATKSSSNPLSTIAYKILSYSAYYREIYNLECMSTLKFDAFYIVKCLINENDDDKCTAILQLIFTSFHTCCINLNKMQLISITPQYWSEYLLKTYRALFFRLQMNCCKESKVQSQNSWQCLNAMLEYGIQFGDEITTKIVAAQPWTHTLIKYYLSENTPHRVHITFLKFVYNWLICLLKCAKNSDTFISDLSSGGYKNTALLKTISLLINTFNIDVQGRLNESKRSAVQNILKIIDVKNHFNAMQIDLISH